MQFENWNNIVQEISVTDASLFYDNQKKHTQRGRSQQWGDGWHTSHSLPVHPSTQTTPPSESHIQRCEGWHNTVQSGRDKRSGALSICLGYTITETKTGNSSE